MTTIAFRDGTLAVDSLMASSYGGRRGLFRKARFVNGSLYAGCGTASTVMEFFRWAEKEEPQDFKFTGKGADDFVGLIVRRDGRLWTAEESLIPWPVEMPYVARGSGSEYAIGAMAMGAAALQAVRVAAQFDAHTAGPFVVWRREGGDMIEETVE